MRTSIGAFLPKTLAIELTVPQQSPVKFSGANEMKVPSHKIIIRFPLSIQRIWNNKTLESLNGV